MALSNIFREPRREITETLVGILIIALPIYADFKFACWFISEPKNPHQMTLADILGGMLIGAFGMFVALLAMLGIHKIALLAMLGIHKIGENVCDSLQARGIRLRPARRF